MAGAFNEFTAYLAFVKLASIRLWLRAYESIKLVSRQIAQVIHAMVAFALRANDMARYSRAPENFGDTSG